MIHRHRLLLLLFLCAAHVTGCQSSRRVVDARPNAELVAPLVPLDTAKSKWRISPFAPPAISQIAVSKPSIFNQATDALGISTAAGRARRQARKDAAATVPRSIGKGAVYAPNNTGKILNAGNKGGAVANADSGAMLSQTDIEKNKGAAATGPGATATAPEATGFNWWWLVAVAVGGYGLYRLYKTIIPFA